MMKKWTSISISSWGDATRNATRMTFEQDISSFVLGSNPRWVTIHEKPAPCGFFIFSRVYAGFRCFFSACCAHSKSRKNAKKSAHATRNATRKKEGGRSLPAFNIRDSTAADRRTFHLPLRGNQDAGLSKCRLSRHLRSAAPAIPFAPG